MSKAVLIPEVSKDIGSLRDEISLSPTKKKDGAISLFSRLLRFDSLSKKESPESLVEPHVTYYGVYIPCEIKKGPDEEALHVYKNKTEALDLVRKYKLARFKAFHSYQEAVTFALRGAEPVDVHDGNSCTLVGEKPYPFKAPSPQEMVALRRCIEGGAVASVRERVWDNPRYLVSSGSTPAIMHEGSRYNALHVAAKAQNAEMCNLILTTVGDPAFVQKLYGNDTDEECCKEFAAILLDRYLNTPDKGVNETAIHFACKFGAADAVEVLTSFPQCNLDVVNKYGQRPDEMICSRASQQSTETADRIRKLLKAKYYVPVIHAADESSPPALGQVYTPAKPPELNTDPLSPTYEIRAYAGPMEAQEAETFRRRWKTPPRVKLSSPAFRRDVSKGLESVGRSLAEEMNVGWKEYWPFLDTFTDLRSKEGLALLENYLKNKYEAACSLAYSDSCNESHVNDFSVSRISISNQATPTKESKDALSPMSELCNALKTCTLSSSERPAHWRKTDPIRQRMCRQPSKFKNLTNGEPAPIINHTVSQLLCIERTCQVFAKRIADALIFSLRAEPEIAAESLKSEAKHLKNTMFTYMDDPRFKDINFALIHNRLAQLVVFNLKQRTSDLDDINHLIEFLVKMRCPNDDIFSSDDERKPCVRGSDGRLKLNNFIDNHVRCLASFISDELVDSELCRGPSVSEGECKDVWERAVKCRCDWTLEHIERNSKKNASFRKNRSILSTSPNSESFIKRLSFDFDMGDNKLQTTEETPLVVGANSPAGDTQQPALLVDTHKCTVIAAEISEDDSGASCHSDLEEESYFTASERSEGVDSDADMQDATDVAIVDTFIYGEEPTKVDRLVYDAVSACSIPLEQYPNIWRWRHSVSLYSPSERDKWRQAPLHNETNTPTSGKYSITLERSPSHVWRARLPLTHSRPSTSTPNKDGKSADVTANRTLPSQITNWLRITGPNSPKSVLTSKKVGHNLQLKLSVCISELLK